MELGADGETAISAGESSLRGTIVQKEFSGNVFRTTVTTEDGQELSIETPSSSRHETAPGTQVTVRWRNSDASILTV